ncbi:MAG: hypothetical protein CME89_17765 [Hirschia sp.]|nr:hypothetical protein [Hirschia sp.]
MEIYDNTDIMGLARVFTGLSRNGGNYWSSGPDGRHTPLVMWDQYHSPHEKTFLGLTISEGTGGEESISRALDQIFAHPNVAPFISRQLIQRFTGSNPHPAYVKRVATAFETGQYISRDGVEIGTGERGDLGATIAAVLLDETLLLNTSDVPVTDGKIREPALRFIQFARAFDMRNADSGNEQWLGDTSSPATRLGQHPFRSPSVFNFYRPGYIAPATETGEAGLTAPEFQIVNASSYIGYSNFMANYIQDRTSRYNKDVNTFEPDYTVEMSLADSPTELVNHLDTLLTGGRMLEGTRANIIDAVDDLPFDADASSDQQEEERLKRVELAIMMATSSPSYFIQR